MNRKPVKGIWHIEVNPHTLSAEIGIKDKPETYETIYLNKTGRADVNDVKRFIKDNKILDSTGARGRGILNHIYAQYNSKKENPTEYLICSAIHIKDGLEYNAQPKNIESGLVVCGRRHHNCFSTIELIFKDKDIILEKVKDHVQGFLTNTDRFVDRREGLEIAKVAKQLKHKDYTIATILTSEDLW